MELTEIEVTYKAKNKEKPKINCSSDGFDYILSDWNLDTIELLEEVKLLLLNRANQVLGKYHLAKGGTASAAIDIKLVLSIALKTNAHGIILVHNHPSGNLNPSQSDIKLTKKLKTACKYVEIMLLDHLIVNQYGYFSFADEGIL